MSEINVIVAQSRTGHNFIYHQFLSWNTPDQVSRIEGYSPEDISENQDLIFSHNNKHLKSIQDPSPRYFIVIRDFENWLASYLLMKIGHKAFDNETKAYKDPRAVDHKIRVWFDIYYEAIGSTNFLPNKTVIDYDEFRTSQAFRMEICKETGGIYTEDNLNSVPLGGSGSSFDGLDYQGRGSEMKTGERKEQIKGSFVEKYYNELLNKYLLKL